VEIHKINPKLIDPQKGRLLISEPFLNDLKFRRSVVFLCEHNEEGSVGFILNRLLSVTSSDVIPQLLEYNFPLFYGGPVETDTLHFIHKAGDFIEGSKEISNGIYWGGEIESVNQLLSDGKVSPNDFRFFIGYSGWAPDQLVEEITEKAWWVAEGNMDIIFDDDLENMWKAVVRSLGKDFAFMANSPDDVTWN